MAKVLGQIITIAGAVVANVVPGLGQIASAAILLGSAAIGSLISGLAGGGSSRPEQSQTTVKTERPPRLRGYGISRRAAAMVTVP